MDEIEEKNLCHFDQRDLFKLKVVLRRQFYEWTW